MTVAGALERPLAAHFDAMPDDWRRRCMPFLASAAFGSLCGFIDERIAAGASVFPDAPLLALSRTGFDEVRVVILGQDPYHGPGQAHGLAFSVREAVPAPPSLRNILGEVARDCGCACAGPVSLLRWARQGVLLLNTVLTVEQGTPGSHARRGWEKLTAVIVGALAASARPKVFLLWGAQAQSHAGDIERAGGPRLVLKANHPSPLSARRGPVPFLGCGHFSKANSYLVSMGCAPVNWCAAR